MKSKYSLIIRWSDEDDCYIAWVPELGTGVKTHGSTYEDAARMGREVIESFVELGGPLRPLPAPWTFDTGRADDGALGRFLFPNNAAYRPWPQPTEHAPASAVRSR